MFSRQLPKCSYEAGIEKKVDKQDVEWNETLKLYTMYRVLKYN